MSCGRECDCESEEAHDAAVDESQRAFLANPGPPPAHFTPEQIERAMRGMKAERARLGVKR